MKAKLLRYNQEPLDIDMNQVGRISGISQSNLIIIMKSGDSYTGYILQFD